ncbi:threonine aldolase [Ascosphaera apis ARSEF 7405]|uniref:Threonine aldolase n=1 Tax=Ascosphaera apis ARSEF 7405 TaxID=392613 RepID=A0A168C759_9EURO|nr:threonine aldolase [Ascosphaera apis ARSEF 7405]
MSVQDGPNWWATPGTAAWDFRSDVITRPTQSMLNAIAQTTLLDDDYMEDPVTNDLQSFIANLTGHEDALLVMSGTMGNQVSLRTHLTQPPYQILCDHRAHIIHWEAGGVPTWTGAYVKGIVPSKNHLTLEDIQKHAILDEDYNGCPTRLISLENTLDGSIFPLDEMRRITDWAHANGLKVHLDGARLWNAVAKGAGKLSDYTKLCDSVSLCFSKGLGAPIGSIIVGNKTFIKKARWFRKSIGGGTRQAGIISAAARVAVEETFGKGETGEGGLLKRSHETAERIAEMWQARGGKLASPVETSMVWLDFKSAGIKPEDWDELGKEKGLKLMGNRLVVHYQNSDEAVEKLGEVMDIALSGKLQTSSQTGKGKYYGQT